MRVSVVVPVLEDRPALVRTLPALAGADEIIVVDASSRDPVREGDLPPGGSLVRCGVAQRAAQMNLGARIAHGEVVWFVHADTLPAQGAPEAVRSAMEDPGVVGGGFERRFDPESPFLRWTGRGAAWRCRRFGWFLGDQAIFVRRRSFEAVGGYPPVNAFEDVELCRRLKSEGALRTLRPPVVSSGRRFAGGAVRRTLADLGLTLAYVTGASRLVAARQNVE